VRLGSLEKSFGFGWSSKANLPVVWRIGVACGTTGNCRENRGHRSNLTFGEQNFVKFLRWKCKQADIRCAWYQLVVYSRMFQTNQRRWGQNESGLLRLTHSGNQVSRLQACPKMALIALERNRRLRSCCNEHRNSAILVVARLKEA